MKTRKTAGLIAVAALGATLAAGCSSQPAVPLTYAPAAYGVAPHCYYVDDPAEVVALQAAGLCPRTWVATPMPLAWEQEYYAYYDSSSYYDTYVPARVRTVYVQREASFGRANRAAIATRSKAATYRTSDGKTVKGSQVTGRVKFGSGKSFGTSGQKYGGGSLRSGSSARPSAPRPAASRPAAPRPRASGAARPRSGSLRRSH